MESQKHDDKKLVCVTKIVLLRCTRKQIKLIKIISCSFEEKEDVTN